jgi:2'-5' RNA ligase
VIADRLRTVAEGRPPFRVTFTGTGAFPNLGKMRVVWIGIDSPGLIDLASTVLEVLPPGEGEKAQPFRPHLTIGRVKFPEGIRQCRDVIERFQDHAFGSLEATEFHLMQSTLTPQGPIYNVIETFSLAAADGT